jgi:hypothetical protein
MGRGTSAGTPEQRTVGTVSTLVKRQVSTASAVERQISTASAPVTEQFSKAGTLLRQILNDLNRLQFQPFAYLWFWFVLVLNECNEVTAEAFRLRVDSVRPWLGRP